jgi:transcriptional regulator with XRE-family HTH domain
VRLTQTETDRILSELSQCRFNQPLSAPELADKAEVSVDYVNRIEHHMPISNPRAIAKVAEALGVTPALMRKIAGYEDISYDELAQLNNCLEEYACAATTQDR